VTSGDRFRILCDQSRLPQAERDRWPESLPWSIVEPWRAQAERNHGQTLERLNERGGLSPLELWLAAHQQRPFADAHLPEWECAEWLIRIVADHEEESAERQRKERLEREFEDERENRLYVRGEP